MAKRAIIAGLALAGLLFSALVPGKALSQESQFTAQAIYSGLDFPAQLAFSPDGRLFFTERLSGKVRVLQNGQLLPEPWAQVETVALAETGLLGLALHPRFPQEPFVYIYYTYREPSGGLYNRVARFREEGGRGGAMEVILDRIPAASIHNGGILAFGADGKLYVTTGDATHPEGSQELSSLSGKILRLNPDGSIPGDNPFPASPVYALGVRNSFGLAFQTGTGRGYFTENGPRENDEVNLLKAGANYGWPLLTGKGSPSGFLDPLLTYTPNIAPTGIAFYTGDKYPPSFRGNPLFGDWNTGSIHRVVLQGEAAAREEVIFQAPSGVLDLEMGPDGYLYFSTPSAIWRLDPLPPPEKDPVSFSLARGALLGAFLLLAIALFAALLRPKQKP